MPIIKLSQTSSKENLHFKLKQKINNKKLLIDSVQIERKKYII
jgi:hypothetical protein